MKNLFQLILIIIIFTSCNLINENKSILDKPANLEIEAPETALYFSISDEEESNYDLNISQKSISKKTNKNDKNGEKNTTNVRKLIKTGSIKFESESISESRNLIDVLIKKHDAFISNEQSINEVYGMEQNISIRIPYRNFDLFIKDLNGKVSKFDYKNISTQDVTEEYIDIDSRLKAKYKLEESYLSLLKKALKIKDIVGIEKELSYVRADIESMEGRLRYLSDQVSLSTLNIIIYKDKPVEYRKERGFLAKLWYNFQLGFDGLLSFFLGLISIWPSLLIIALVLFVIRRWWKKRKKK